MSFHMTSKCKVGIIDCTLDITKVQTEECPQPISKTLFDVPISRYLVRFSIFKISQIIFFPNLFLTSLKLSLGFVYKFSSLLHDQMRKTDSKRLFCTNFPSEENLSTFKIILRACDMWRCVLIAFSGVENTFFLK